MTRAWSGKQNAAVTAFLRSTNWKLLIAADVVAVGLGVVAYFFTNNILAFAPTVLVMALIAFSILRVSQRGVVTPAAEDDPIVK